MKTVLRVVIFGLVASFFSGCATFSDNSLVEPKPYNYSQSSEIDWEVVNRFRVIDGEAEEERFFRDVANYLEEVWKWSDNEKKVGPFPNFLFSDLVHHGRRTGEKHERDYNTYYDKKKYSYNYTGDVKNKIASGEKWATDPGRTIWASWRSAQAKNCIWTLTKDDIIVETKKTTCDAVYERGSLCSPSSNEASNCFNVQKDVSYRLTAVADDASGRTRTTPVYVTDKSFVALGDSFSSGEGVPHMQWRLVGKPHPTIWWDGRCNRSLLSGPSLSAAIYSRQNKKNSVTLMHYGCSGASVDDGIVRPWRGLETSERVQRRQTNSVFKFLGYKPDEEDIQPCIGTDSLQLTSKTDASPKIPNECRSKDADIIPSQIAMAAHDLDRESNEPNDYPISFPSGLMKPDYVLISAGGNDVGFASIVTSIAASPMTAVDLKPDHRVDNREYISTDQKRFNTNNYTVSQLIDVVESADVDSTRCSFENLSVKESTLCFLIETLENHKKERVNNRISAIANAHYRIGTTIPENYEDLFYEVNARLNPKRVIVTRYPSALSYKRKKTDEKFKFCEDRSLDGKPGLIPSPINSLRGIGLGVQEKYSKLGDEYILKYLNETIDITLETLNGDGAPNWTTTSDDAFDITKPFGYCNIEARTFNTIVDSIFFQGFSPKTDLPIGTVYDNKEVTRSENAASWDVNVGDYKLIRRAGQPANVPDGLPNIEAKHGKSGVRYERDRKKTDELSVSGPLPTGPFHPTVLGHCMYALAIMEQIDPSGTNLKEDKDGAILVNNLRIDKQNAGWEKETLRTLCSADTFGYKTR